MVAFFTPSSTLPLHDSLLSSTEFRYLTCVFSVSQLSYFLGSPGRNLVSLCEGNSVRLILRVNGFLGSVAEFLLSLL